MPHLGELLSYTMGVEIYLLQGGDLAIPVFSKADVGFSWKVVLFHIKDIVIIVDSCFDDKTHVFYKKANGFTGYVVDYGMHGISGMVLFYKCHDNRKVVIDGYSVYRMMRT